MAIFFNSVVPPFPFNPATRIVSSGSPACGTSFISIPRCVPTKTTSRSAPREIHSRAIAIAGNTCPPVPPPAISNFTPSSSVAQASACVLHATSGPGFSLYRRATSTHSQVRFYQSHKPSPHFQFLFSKTRRACLLRNIQEHAGCQQHHQQTRPAIAHKRQRNPLRRHHPEHHREINQALENHHRRHAQRQHASKAIRRIERRAQSTPAVHGKKRQHEHRPKKSQFLADHRVNKVCVRLRQIKQFLLSLHQSDSAEAPRTHGDQRLHQLESRALRIRIQIG